MAKEWHKESDVSDTKDVKPSRFLGLFFFFFKSTIYYTEHGARRQTVVATS